MTYVGVQTTFTESPGANASPFSTGNAFIVGLGDWGSSTSVATAHSQADVSAAIGPRSSTNSVLWDACDAFFREGGSTAFISRVVGPTPVKSTLVLKDGSSVNAIQINAADAGNYGNAITVAVTNNSTSVTITLSDAATYGSYSILNLTSPALNSLSAIASWLNGTGVVTASVESGSPGLPATIAATPLAGGSDDRTDVTVTQWETALGNFGYGLGPGQVIAPGQTNTTLSGIWTALGQHASANNRVALANMDDNVSADTLISDLGNTFNNTGVGPIAFFAGDLAMPGQLPLTTRYISPDAAVAGLIARADATGNPNLAAAGINYGYKYITGPKSIVSGVNATYNQSDLNALNAVGINTNATKSQTFCNYGFASSIQPTVDQIMSQFNHERLRMALQADAEVLGEPFVFSELDGSGADVAAFNTALTARLKSYQTIGALWGFTVDTSSAVNTPATLASGQLLAKVSIQMSPFAQSVEIMLNAVPLTQSLPVVTS